MDQGFCQAGILEARFGVVHVDTLDASSLARSRCNVAGI